MQRRPHGMRLRRLRPASAPGARRALVVLVVALIGVLATALASVALAQTAPIAGTFSDDRVSVTLGPIGGGQYTGFIAIDGARYQLSASGSPERVAGTFLVGGSSFAFQAEVAGDVLTLVSGASRYTLRRHAEAAAPQPSTTGQRLVRRGTLLSYDHGAVSHAGTNAGPDVRSVGGRGITQYTVLHLDERTCVMSMALFMEGANPGSVILDPFSGFTIVSRDGTCPDVWSPPERLAAYTPPPGSTQQVTRGPFQLPSGGHTVEALYVREELAGTRSARAWDLATGVVVVATDGTGPVQAPAPEPTSSAYMHLVDVRTPAYPWDVHAALPASVQALSGLRFSGSVTSTFVGLVAPPHVERFEGVLDVAERSTDLLLLRARGGNDGTYVALGAMSWLFIPPEGLAQLRPGQRIDEDPVVGTVLSVERVDAGSVVLAVDGPGLTIRRTFDTASGVQRSEWLETNNGIMHLVIETHVTTIP